MHWAWRGRDSPAPQEHDGGLGSYFFSVGRVHAPPPFCVRQMHGARGGLRANAGDAPQIAEWRAPCKGLPGLSCANSWSRAIPVCDKVGNHLNKIHPTPSKNKKYVRHHRHMIKYVLSKIKYEKPFSHPSRPPYPLHVGVRVEETERCVRLRECLL